HVEAEVVADRHLVDEPAEVGLELGQPARKLGLLGGKLRDAVGGARLDAGDRVDLRRLAARPVAIPEVGCRIPDVDRPDHLTVCASEDPRAPPGALLSGWTVLPEVAITDGRFFCACS